VVTLETIGFNSEGQKFEYLKRLKKDEIVWYCVNDLNESVMRDRAQCI